MTKPSIKISINTFEDTTNHDFGRAFITALCREDERLIPEQLGLDKAYKDSFKGIDNFVEKWWQFPIKCILMASLTQKELKGNVASPPGGHQPWLY